MKAEEFVKIWQEQNQNIVHIPSEYESQLMEAYANYKCSSLQYQLEKEREDKKKLEAAFINHAPTEIVKEYFNIKPMQ